MPVDTNGNAIRPTSPIPVTGQGADAPQVNIPIDDVYSILNLLVFLDGRKPMRGNQDFGGYRATNAADASGDKDLVTLSQVMGLIGSIAGVPTGTMAPFSGNNTPAGWVRANGQALDRTGYAALWAHAQASGNLASSQEGKTAGQYGPGNGATTFTLPNLEADGGYFIRPVSSGRGVGTVQAEDFKSHAHTGATTTAGEHAHYYSQPTTAGVFSTAGPSYPVPGETTGVTSSAGNHFHTFETNSAGGSETRPKNIAYPVLIKA